MQILQINYQLGGPETSTSYKDIGEAIQKLGKTLKPMKSVWFLKSPESVQRVSDYLTNLLDSNDKLFVAYYKGSHSFGLSKEEMDWLNNRI